MHIDEQVVTPLVTVIMPAYNVSKYIEESITSVIRQTFVEWELIVIDDCSKDNTSQVAQNLAKKDSRIQIIENDVNMGVAKTRNRGVSLSRGKYIAFLDSDDYWDVHFLEKMVSRIRETEADLVYCSYELVGEEGQKVCNDFLVPPSTTFEDSIVRSVITCSTVLMTSDVSKKNPFPTDVYHEDIALWFTLLKNGKVAKGVTDVLAAYRQRENSRSSNKIKSACRRWMIYRKHLKMPFVKSVWTMLRYAYHGVEKFKHI